MSFWQLPRMGASPAGHRGFVNIAGLSSRPFKQPIMPNSVGQKVKETFLPSCGYAGLIHCSVLDICESYKQSKGLWGHSEKF